MKTALISYNRTATSSKHLDEARIYVAQCLQYDWVHIKDEYDFEYYEDKKVNIRFILCSDRNSGYINKDQYNYWFLDDNEQAPVYFLYKRKSDQTWSVYNINALPHYSNNTNKYASLDNFRVVSKFQSWNPSEVEYPNDMFKYRPQLELQTESIDDVLPFESLSVNEEIWTRVLFAKFSLKKPPKIKPIDDLLLAVRP